MQSRALVWTALLIGISACDPPDGSGTLDKQSVALPTGVTLSYVELGSPFGEPVIFLHGYTDTARSFWPTAQALAAMPKPRRIFVLDQRGHGGSSMPSPGSCAAAPEDCFAPADLADDVLAFMDEKGIAHAAIVGHSMGSFVAQELALDHPERVDSVVLIGTGAKLVGNVVLQQYIVDEPVEGSWKAGFQAQGYAFPGDVYTRTPAEGSAEALGWIESFWVVEPAADPEFIAAIVPETAATRMGTWIGAARALLATDNGDRLEDLTVPALVLWATQDAVFSAGDQDELLARLDVAAASCDSRWVYKQYGKRPLPADGVPDDIGHNTQWALPHAVARDVDAWLRTGEPTKELHYAAEDDPQKIVVEHGAAVVERSAPCD
jgi:pimeloyl-ACP methyl ester carboxylesterase